MIVKNELVSRGGGGGGEAIKKDIKPIKTFVPKYCNLTIFIGFQKSSKCFNFLLCYQLFFLDLTFVPFMHQHLPEKTLKLQTLFPANSNLIVSFKYFDALYRKKNLPPDFVSFIQLNSILIS